MVIKAEAAFRPLAIEEVIVDVLQVVQIDRPLQGRAAQLAVLGIGGPALEVDRVANAELRPFPRLQNLSLRRAAAHGDRQAVAAGGPGGVSDGQHGCIDAVLRVGVGRVGGVAVLAVAKVPGIADDALFRVGAALAGEGDLQRGWAAQRVGGGGSGGRLVAPRRVADAPDAAQDHGDHIDRAVVAGGHLYDPRHVGGELVVIGAAVGVESQELDHAAVEVVEEVSAAVQRREDILKVEVAADGRAALRVLGAVRIAVDSVRDGRVAALVGVAVGIGGRLVGAFIAGPAEVGPRPAAVDLLPVAVAHVGHNHLAVARVNGEAEGVAHPHRKDLGAVAVGVAVKEGIVPVSLAGDGVDAQNLAVEAVGVEGAAVALGVDDAVPAGDIERAVRPKAHRVEAVGRALGGDAVAHEAAGVVKAGERLGVAGVGVAHVLRRAVGPQDHHAATRQRHIQVVGVGGEAQHARDACARRVAILDFRRVIGVSQVDIGRPRPVGVHGDPQQPTVGRVVDLGGDVDKGVGQQLPIARHAHDAVLLGDQKAAVRQHGEAGGPVQPQHHRLLDKAVGQVESTLGARRLHRQPAAQPRQQQRRNQQQVQQPPAPTARCTRTTPISHFVQSARPRARRRLRQAYMPVCHGKTLSA